MIRFIYGSYGSGKTSAIFNMIKNDTENGRPAFLIVPDQEVLQAERLSLDILPVSSQLKLEILSFSRLYNRVCREYGGLSYSYLTNPMRSLIMWKTLHELKGLLGSLGKGHNDPRITDVISNTVNEFKANGISSAAIELAANKLPDDSPLKTRLLDISLIYSCFDNFLEEKYSDSADDLQRLYDVLCKHSFFEEANVYIDSFTSYTGVQHQIIDQIFKSAKNVTVTIPMASPTHSGISTKGIEFSHKKLLYSAERRGGYEKIILSENKRASSPCLDYLSKNLWTMNAEPVSAPAPDESIITEICDTPYAEAEAVAAHIRKLLREGARCRDIVIIARDVEKYRGILDTALDKSDIPFYFAQKADLCAMPAVKFILLALRIKKYNWQKNDVISFIKTGLCNIDTHEADLFEEYVNTWNIHGERFLDDVWTMNPDGFVSRLSPRGEEILRSANSIREKITAPLLKLFIMLDAAQDTASMCRALYTFMTEVELEEKLASLAQKAANRGDLDQARQLSKIYSVILRSLADIGEIIGDESADTEEFMLILKNVFDKTEIGTIPTSVDEVTVGSASMLRASNPKYAFVIGLCEGEFPTSVKDNGFLSYSDRETLSGLGIELSSNNEISSSDELMYVERAFSCASHKLFALTHKAEINNSARFPSIAFNRIEKLFGETMKPHAYNLSEMNDLIPAPKNAAGILRSIDDPGKKNALRKAIGEYIPEFAELSSVDSTADKCTVSADVIDMAMGKSLYMSSTSFEKYVKCPFSYFCSNVLKLREDKNSNFNANDMGSFVHYILETLVSNSIPNDPSEPIVDDELLIKRTDEAIEAYLREICPPALMDSNRLKHLYRRLKNLSLLLVRNTVKEFSQSDFRPVFFELRADGKNRNPQPLIFTLDDGSSVTFTGVVDRVDLYKKDGNAYIRIVDYKTGDKDFSLEDIDKGINLQMLIYLFTLCRNGSYEFKKALGVEENGQTLPAGVIYLSAAIPTVEADDYGTTDEVLSNAEDKLSRSGLILNEEEIILAMNRQLDSKFLAGIKRDRNSALTGKALADSEDFSLIYEKINAVVKKIAGELRSGNADADPLIYKKESPCDYCKVKALCRKDKEKGDSYYGKELDS